MGHCSIHYLQIKLFVYTYLVHQPTLEIAHKIWRFYVDEIEVVSDNVINCNSLDSPLSNRKFLLVTRVIPVSINTLNKCIQITKLLFYKFLKFEHTNCIPRYIISPYCCRRYTKSPSLYAVELLNEPLSPGATLESLTKYYKAGYEAVRKHSSTAYVVMSNRIGPSDPRELFPVANGLMQSVIDYHYYNLFESKFDNMNVQQNIDFIQNNRSAQLTYVTASNGPLTFVGKSSNDPSFTL